MPQRFDLEEPVIDAAIAKLRQGLSSRLTAINTEFADGIPLPVPASESVFPFGVPDASVVPLIVVTDGGTGESTFQEEGPHGLTANYALVVMVCDQDANREWLGRKLLRLERACLEVLYDDPPAEQLVIERPDGTITYPYIKPVRTVPGPVFNPENDETMFRQWRIVLFDVLKSEN
jgi:hypothetical protein